MKKSNPKKIIPQPDTHVNVFSFLKKYKKLAGFGFTMPVMLKNMMEE
ncbi:hypothetical protein [Pedobacter sp. KACC 23697]|uniref:Uncharacterized protein n=1 Tax=Pedobacter sp. KACC 23697 TaxID=3149230 RepID=A0AAU7K5X4_9SPHI